MIVCSGFLWYHDFDRINNTGGESITLQNSYIFLSNPYKKGKKKEKRTPDGAIILDVGKNVYSYISAVFPNLTKDKESSNLFRREYGCSVQVGTDCCEVKFIINEVVDITYLDVVAEGKTKAQIIKCLEQVQDTLLSSGVREDFIDIVSYDARILLRIKSHCSHIYFTYASKDRGKNIKWLE